MMRRLSPALLLAAALWAGCEAGREPETLAIAIDWEVTHPLPVLESNANESEINGLLYLTLNSARWEGGRLEYLVNDRSLSRGWSFSPDSTTLTYELRPDAVWSDGEPITSRDVVFTYDLVRDTTVGSVYGFVWQQIDSIVPRDEHHVTFHFDRRYPGMLFHSGLGIVPAHVYAPYLAEGHSLSEHPAVAEPDSALVVSGPYRVAELRRGERLVLEANPGAFTGRPATERVVFRVLPEATTRMVELRDGRVHVVDPVPEMRAAELAAEPGLRIETVEDRYFDYIAWNGERFEPFADPAIRRALSLGIDRAAILEGLGIEDYAHPAANPYPPIFSDRIRPDVRPDPYRPDSARAILAAAGWTDDDGDGILDRDGRPFRFTLLTQAGNDRREDAAEILQAQYRRIGIDMAVRTLEFTTLQGAVFDRRDYQAALFGWSVGLEPDYLEQWFWPPDGYTSTSPATPTPPSTA